MAGNLVDYRVEKGVAIFELNDPPANTYTYEMNRELDDCILRARMDDEIGRWAPVIQAANVKLN